MTRSTDSRPIGVFDSGVGGLTVLSEIRRRLPEESTVYLGDNERTPYGPRPADEVRRFTLECVDWLLRQDVKALVLACNTATSRALVEVRDASPMPVLGVVRPGAVTAAAATRSGHVGVIATQGTVESGAYPKAIHDADRRLTVRQQACPELVPLVEAGKLEGPETAAVVNGYLKELLRADPTIDTLLLGCTHYPLLRPLIERRVGPEVAVVDSAFTTALATEDLLDAIGARAPARTSGEMEDRHRIATTGDVAAFSTVAERVFGARLPRVEAAAVGAH